MPRGIPLCPWFPAAARLRNMAQRPARRLAIGSRTTVQENQPSEKLQLETISFLNGAICRESF